MIAKGLSLFSAAALAVYPAGGGDRTRADVPEAVIAVVEQGGAGAAAPQLTADLARLCRSIENAGLQKPAACSQEANRTALLRVCEIAVKKGVKVPDPACLGFPYGGSPAGGLSTGKIMAGIAAIGASTGVATRIALKPEGSEGGAGESPVSGPPIEPPGRSRGAN